MNRFLRGRFDRDSDPHVENFTASLHFDYLLISEDVEGSLAHVDALWEAGLLSEEEASTLKKGLREVHREVQEEIEKGKFKLDLADEDIHMHLEKRLTEKVGDIGGKLHTGRSRNDQVALDLHLYLKKEIREIDVLLEDFQKTLIDLAEKNLDVIMPGYTHLQRAQPVLFSHHIMAYFWMLQRDRERLEGVRDRTDLMPLGAGALAGSGFNLNRSRVAKALGFSRLYENSMDAVSDRDYLVEFLCFSSTNMMHLSRLCEELVLWCSSEFNFIELDQSHTTGSSLMPQKKNPDVAELVRGKTGRVYGALVGVLTLLKGLPLTYNKDLQEDKEGLFDTVKTVKLSLFLCKEMLKGARLNRKEMEQAVESGFSGATDLADYLVRKGVPFREAHHIIGELVSYCEKKNLSLKDLNREQWLQFHHNLDLDEISELLFPLSSVRSKNLRGGTAPEAVREQIKEARRCMQK